MGLSAEQLKANLDAIAAIEPAMAAAIGRAGYPPPRVRDPGYATLLRTIVGQQVSVAAAAAIWNKLAAALGDLDNPATIAALSIDALRPFGLSRQKAGYALSLADEVTSGRINLHALPADDEEAIGVLTQIKGIGRWSAEIYLLFAEGRGDIWPAGDLAVQIEIGRILGLEARPSEKETRLLAEPWRPNRGAAAIMAWHHYKVDMAVV